MAGAKFTDEERAVATLATMNLLPATTAVTMMHKARQGGDSLAEQLLAELPEQVLLGAIATELGLEFIDLFDPQCPVKVDPKMVTRAEVGMLTRGKALPTVNRDTGDVVIAMANPRSNPELVDYLRGVFPEGFTVALAPGSQIDSRLVYYETPESSAAAAGSDEKALAASASVVDWVDNMLARAAAEGVSDIHLLSQANNGLLLRFRVDGVLARQPMPLRGREFEVLGSLLSRCPTIDPSDRTRPQDGAFSFTAPGGRSMDVRLAMLPQLHGPLITMRLLDPKNVRKRLEDMGIGEANLAKIIPAVRSNQGLILVVGPTGSGKTTTLYGLLNELDAGRLNILTAEDPVEYRLAGIGQTQIRGDLGDKSLTFAKALRAFLRLDPDVILVGEIRDVETADTAMHAALTGHLVLSTVHAKSALGVYQRLDELGGEPYMVAEALSLAVSQRLMRRVHSCATVEAPTPAEVAFLTRQGLAAPDTVAHPRPMGCSGCNGTGFRGRMPVMEVLAPNAAIRQLVATRASMGDIVRAGEESGSWSSILVDAHRHVVAHATTVSEMLRCLDTGGAQF